MTDRAENQAVAEQICRDFVWKGQAFTLGQFVALAAGRVVGVAEDMESALQQLRAAEPDPRRGMIIEVAPPVVDVIR